LAAPVGWAGVKAAARQAGPAGLSAGACRCFGGCAVVCGILPLGLAARSRILQVSASVLAAASFIAT
jgi:hypothetical protein